MVEVGVESLYKRADLNHLNHRHPGKSDQFYSFFQETDTYYHSKPTHHNAFRSLRRLGRSCGRSIRRREVFLPYSIYLVKYVIRAHSVERR
jgi:hypothetical protein